MPLAKDTWGRADERMQMVELPSIGGVTQCLRNDPFDGAGLALDETLTRASAEEITGQTQWKSAADAFFV